MQRGHALVLQVYRFTKTFPPDERFGTTSQIRRAAASIPSNIAEGSKRTTRKDYARYLNIAEGSAAELEYFVMLARDLELLEPKRSAPLLAEIQELARMIYTLRQRVERVH